MRIDPMTEDDMVAVERQDEDLRAERWAEFVVFLKHLFQILGFSKVLRIVAKARKSGVSPDWKGPVAWKEYKLEIIQFAETEGWGGVLAAMARAVRENEGR